MLHFPWIIKNARFQVLQLAKKPLYLPVFLSLPEPSTELPPTWVVGSSSHLFRGWVGGSTEGKWTIPSLLPLQNQASLTGHLFKINGKKTEGFPSVVQKNNIKVYTHGFVVFYHTQNKVIAKLISLFSQFYRLRNVVNHSYVKNKPTPFIQTNCFCFYIITCRNHSVRRVS